MALKTVEDSRFHSILEPFSAPYDTLVRDCGVVHEAYESGERDQLRDRR